MRSKQHATIYDFDGRWFVRDLDSHNGVVVNGRRVNGEAELTPGAQIILGDVRFRFSVEDSSAELDSRRDVDIGPRPVGGR